MLPTHELLGCRRCCWTPRYVRSRTSVRTHLLALPGKNRLTAVGVLIVRYRTLSGPSDPSQQTDSPSRTLIIPHLGVLVKRHLQELVFVPLRQAADDAALNLFDEVIEQHVLDLVRTLGYEVPLHLSDQLSDVTRRLL